MTILLILVAVLCAGAIGAGSFLFAKKRYTPPTSAAGHVDELLYLKDGAYVSYDPPQYIPEGESPVAATWEMNRKTGKQHHTRRVQAP